MVIGTRAYSGSAFDSQSFVGLYLLPLFLRVVRADSGCVPAVTCVGRV